jgi:hypothetical protein
MPREKEPGVDIEEQKSRLRVEEVDALAKDCEACAKERRESGDPTAYCAEHLRKIYGV